MEREAETMGGETIDPRALRRALGAFATGVTIVATRDAAGEPVGFTANSFASVSLTPPLVLVCLAETAASYPAFRDAGRFAVNVLSAAQRETAVLFATRGADKFAAARWAPGPTGAPLIEGSAAWFDCLTERAIPAGDHVILLGRVVEFGQSDAAPLGYCRGAYVSFGVDGAAFTPHRGGVRVAAIVERRGAALLRLRPDGGAALPSAAAFGPADNPASLLGQLAAAGAAAELPFVFASYDLGDTHHVVYRGAAHDAPDPPPGWRFARPADAPFAAMAPDEAAILRRYLEERAAHIDGRYVGDAR